MTLPAATRKYSNIQCLLLIILFGLTILITRDSNGVDGQWRGKSSGSGSSSSSSSNSNSGIYGSIVSRPKRKSGNSVTENFKNKIFASKQALSGIKSDDKQGLALLAADYNKVAQKFPTKQEPSAYIVHRYQYTDINLVVNNIFSFTSEVVHPPRLDDLKLNSNQTDDERSLISKFTDRIQTGIASAEAYADLVLRYQRWYSLHRKLEELDPSVSGFLGILWREFSHSMAEVREEFSVPRTEYPKLTIRSRSFSSSDSDSDSDSDDDDDYDHESQDEKPPAAAAAAAKQSVVDFVYESLKRTIPRLEEKLSEEDYNQKLGPARNYLNNKIVDDRIVKERIKAFKNTVTKEAKNWLISETRHMAKVALFSAITSYVTSRYKDMPSEDSMVYAARLLGFLGAASVPLAVSTLRDHGTRAALTLLDIVNPFPNLTELLKKGFTAKG